MDATLAAQRTTIRDAVSEVTTEVLAESLATARAVSATAAQWLTERVHLGEPAFSAERNSWWRMPWALTLSGHRDVAAGILAWADRVALTDDGDLRPGPYRVDEVRTPVYQLTHLALAAHLTDRYDLSSRLYAKVLDFWNHNEGGAFVYRDQRDGETDWLMTAQVGLVAIAVGDNTVRDQTFDWFRQMWQWQTDLDSLKLVTGRNERGLNAQQPADLPFNINVVDFTQPRQMYFQPGAAAAFLAQHAAQTGSQEAIDIARGLMRLNIDGTLAQLTDETSVHVCKFPWGAAELCALDTQFDWAPYLVLLNDWFRDRQDSDGSWAPSAFTLAGPAEDVDRMWKTAEHLMEVEKIAAALSARLASAR